MSDNASPDQKMVKSAYSDKWKTHQTKKGRTTSGYLVGRSTRLAGVLNISLM